MERLEIITRGLLTPTWKTCFKEPPLSVFTAPSGVYNELLKRGTLENVLKWFHASGDTRRSLHTKTLQIGSKVFLDHITEGLESTAGSLENLSGEVLAPVMAEDDLFNLVIPICP